MFPQIDTKQPVDRNRKQPSLDLPNTYTNQQLLNNISQDSISTNLASLISPTVAR